MNRFLIFICLWSLSLPEEHVNISNTKRLQNESNAYYRYSRDNYLLQSEKLLPCHKMYKTEETPWVAIILSKDSGRLVCMGSIIDDRHILTAVKCSQYAGPLSMKVLLGYRKAWWGERSQVIAVDKVFKHHNDLMILRLARAIKFSKTVQKIELYETVKGEDDIWIKKHDLNEEKDLGSLRNGLTFTFENDRPKRHKLEIEPAVEDFPDEIEEVYIIGFPVAFADIIGNPIQKNIFYVKREDKITDRQADCLNLLDEPEMDRETDPNFQNRHICIEGNSKFCWGSLGGPVLDKKTMKQVGIIAVAGYSMDCEKTAEMLLARRTDVYVDWIRTNSYVLQE